MFKSLAKKLPHSLQLRLYHRYDLPRQAALARAAAERTGLPLLETLDLSKVKTSDTVFILGSGASINEIPAPRWERIGRHDSIGLNFWPVHPFVPRIYLFETVARIEGSEAIFDALQSVLNRRANDYRRVVKVISEVWPTDARQLVFELPEGLYPNLYLGYSSTVIARNQKELIAGLRYLRRLGIFAPGDRLPWHFKYAGSVLAALSLAVRMGYRRIVLCGIDMGKAEHFYHDPQRYPEEGGWEFVPRTALHMAARRLEFLVPGQEAVVHFQREILDPAQIELFVENRSSKLFPNVAEMPASLWEQLAAPAAARVER
jgi:hypothetical protein